MKFKMVYVKSNELYHHGIKGQRWGIRRYQNEDGSLTEAGKARLASGDVPRSTRRTAKHDAKEYARAQMYYGEGAGTRRKLIKATVEERKKHDPFYADEFERQLAKQDMASHAAKARAERKTRDVAKTTAKTTRGIINQVLGTGARVTASAAAIYTIAHYTGLDQKVMDYGRTKLRDIKLRYDTFR